MDAQNWRAMVDLRAKREQMLSSLGVTAEDRERLRCEATLYVESGSTYAEKTANRIDLILKAAGFATKKTHPAGDEFLADGIRVAGKAYNFSDSSTTCAQQVADSLRSIFDKTINFDIRNGVTPNCDPAGKCIQIDVGLSLIHISEPTRPY